MQGISHPKCKVYTRPGHSIVDCAVGVVCVEGIIHFELVRRDPVGKRSTLTLVY